MQDDRANETTRAKRSGLPGAMLTVLFAVVAAVSGIAARTARAGDAELAKFLVKGGRDDLAKKQYDDALKKLQKARVEDPLLLEALYWMGAVHDARKDPRAALVAYRAYAVAYTDKKSGSVPVTRDEEALLAKVQARLEVLAAAELELTRLREAYVAQLLAFAEENFVRDPAVTSRALRQLLAIQPKHASARRLLEKMGGEEAAALAAESDPFGVRTWEDLVATKRFESADGLEYVDDKLVIERSVGVYLFARDVEPTTAKYVLDAELQFTTETGARVVGFGFGVGSVRIVSLMFTATNVDLVVIDQSKHTTVQIASKNHKRPIELHAWHRVTIVVDGIHVEVQVDGSKLLEADVKDATDLDGKVGLYVQGCRTELKTLKLGRRP